MAGDRIGEDPEIIPKAFGNNVEVTAGFFKLPAVPVVRSSHGGSQSLDIGFD